MSQGPGSHGRNSYSPDLSYTSSRTLNSRFSGSYDDNGEGSSSHTAGSSGPRSRSRDWAGHEDDVTWRNSGSHLGDATIEQQDFAPRRHRKGRSGGFLLDPMVGRGRHKQQSRHSAHSSDAKGKRSSRLDHYAGPGEDGASPSHSSPLSRDLGPRGSASNDHRRVVSSHIADHDGSLSVPKTRDSIRIAEPARRAPSPMYEDESPRAAIDPHQIVRLALELNESRRRNISPGQLIAPQPSGSPRAASTARSQDAGGNLRQYLNEQRRASRNISPYGGRAASQNVSKSLPRSMSMSVQGQILNPTPATLARRDKAQAYIELKIEYLRLLDVLPPLKPDASAPGNHVFTAHNMPGSPQAMLTRVHSYAGKRHELGRPYNPLQMLRNRRLRARVAKPLYHAPQEFQHVDEVRAWVDRAERASQHPNYRQQDRVKLPGFHDGYRSEEVPTKSSSQHTWQFTPEELLADAQWLEQGDNKAEIENRYSHRIFPASDNRNSDFLDVGRSSKDYPDKRRRSWVDGLAGKTGEPGTGDESETASDRGRKRRLLPGFRADSPRQRKHRLHGAAHSDSSGSDSEVSKRKSRRRRGTVDLNENTGALGLHLKEIMESDAKEQADTTMITSPDTPDKWGPSHHDEPDTSAYRSSIEGAFKPNGSAQGSLDGEFKRPPRQRTDNTLTSEQTAEPRSSFESRDSSIPDSPVRRRHLLRIGSDLSSPPSREGSLKKKSRLDIFRSDDHAKTHKRARSRDPADMTGKQNGSRQSSGENPEGGGLGTTILGAPSAVKSLLTHRKNDSVSSVAKTDQRKEAKEVKDVAEPSSAVTRFLKGVKHEGTRVGDIIFRKDRPADDSGSEDSDILLSPAGSDTEGKESKFRPRISRTGTANSTATTGSLSGKHARHVELPSFRSHTLQEQDDAFDSNAGDHISRQARARAQSRPSRFDRLAPQGLDLQDISSHTTPNGSRAHSPVAVRERMNRTLARPGGVGMGGLPVTSLTHAQRSPSRSSSTSSLNHHRQNPARSRPGLQSRQWSITDSVNSTGSQPQSRSQTHLDAPTSSALHRTPSNPATSATQISTPDIARIKALFLCSGIKAQALLTRALEPRHPSSAPAPFLLRAARAANKDPYPVRRREEHVLAASFLNTSLESDNADLRSACADFQSSRAAALAKRIATLRADLEMTVLPRVRDAGDRAVAITARVSGDAPLEVKRVADEIERLKRGRRRRMRWARRVGWGCLEWALLGVMWWVWGIVVLLGVVRRVVGGVGSGVRWLLWL